MEINDLIQRLIDIREERGNKPVKIALYPGPVTVCQIASVTGYGSTIYIDVVCQDKA